MRGKVLAPLRNILISVYSVIIVLLCTLILQYGVVCVIVLTDTLCHTVYVIIFLNCRNPYSLRFSVIRGTFGVVHLKLSRFYCNTRWFKYDRD